MQSVVTALLAGVLAVVSSSTLSATPKSESSALAQCQYYKNWINHYTGLRKKGGSARQMEYWKQKRDPYEDSFQSENCKRFGKKLK